jgi:hypothetical protein
MNSELAVWRAERPFEDPSKKGRDTSKKGEDEYCKSVMIAVTSCSLRATHCGSTTTIYDVHSRLQLGRDGQENCLPKILTLN